MDSEYHSISAIVLAAGLSRRMGLPKLLLPLDGRTLIERSVQAPLDAGLGETVAVLGAGAGALRQCLARRWPDCPSLRIVENPGYAEGLSTSVKAGLNACGKTACAVLFCLGDQPFITGDTIRRIAGAYMGQANRPPVVVPVHLGLRGNPVLFDRRLFSEILRLSGDTGAREVIDRHRNEVLTVECGSEILVDVDTAEDYERLRTAPSAHL